VCVCIFRLIYPLSVFGLLWVSITALFLAYTAVVTPPVIAYHWLDPECATVPTCVCEERGVEKQREREERRRGGGGVRGKRGREREREEGGGGREGWVGGWGGGCARTRKSAAMTA